MTRIRHLVEDGLVQTLDACMRPLPMTLVRRCGRALGVAVCAVDRRHRRTALENLAMAFPDAPLRERRRVARGVFAHFGSVLLELLKAGHLPPERLRDLVEIEGADRVRDAHRHGRGVLLFTGHFGYWELNALVHALALQPISVMARSLDNPLLHERLERIRTRMGNEVIYRESAMRKVLRDLHANRAVAILIDQHVHGANAVAVDFFGRPAATTTALAALALRTGAPVIPAFTIPLPRGRYRVVYEHPVEPPDPDTPDAVRLFTQRCTDVLQRYVRRHPELWLWLHRRWRMREEAGSPRRSSPALEPEAHQP